MKLLVLAQTPPPLHGQSTMVRVLVDGLPHLGIALHHVNLRLSHDAADIGRWRPAKIFATLGYALRSIAARFRHGCDTLYYVPAPPAKRGALYRDWVVMALCRPFFRHLVLHWHAVGLGEWLARDASAFERTITRALLGRADLSLVLGERIRADIADLHAGRTVVLPNGIADPVGAADACRPPPAEVFQVVFLGMCCAEKGLFDLANALLAANLQHSTPRFRLVAAGPFVRAEEQTRFHDISQAHPGELSHVGFLTGEAKHQLLRQSHCLCLPSWYFAEGQPLVLLEAMAHDLPIIATRWRAIPDTVPPEAILIEPGDVAALTLALEQMRRAPTPAGVFRRHFLAHFTTERHLERTANALRELERGRGTEAAAATKRSSEARPVT